MPRDEGSRQMECTRDVTPETGRQEDEAAAGLKESADATLLLKAFQTFTRASDSLESAYQQLQERARRLSEELENKNRELARSVREKDEVQRFLKTILERLPCGVLALDNDGAVILCNPMAAQILEQPSTREAVVGRRRRRKCTVLRDYFAASVTRHGGAGEVEMPFVRGGAMRILATSGTALIGRNGEPA